MAPALGSGLGISGASSKPMASPSSAILCASYSLDGVSFSQKLKYSPLHLPVFGSACFWPLAHRASRNSALAPSILYSLSSSLSYSSGSRLPARLGLGFASCQGSDARQGATIGVCAARSMAGGDESLDDLIRAKNAASPVVVYSKSWCPYCNMVKGLFEKLGVKIVAIELDQMVEEQGLQGALRRISGQTTVPNVFIGGKHIGGCDDTMALHSKGELLPLLSAAGAQQLGPASY